MWIFLLFIASVSGQYCQPKWHLSQNFCYKRIEEAPRLQEQTCKNFGSIRLGQTSGPELEFVNKITAGGPLGSNRGDFVCRKASTPSPAQVQRTRPLPTSNLDCAGVPGWFGLKYTNKCYKLFFQHVPLNWQQAQNACQKHGGSLVIIRNTQEHDHVLNMAHDGIRTMFNEFPMIGLKKDGATWRWVDGTTGGITKFSPGEPNFKGANACARLVSDQAIYSDLKLIYSGQYGNYDDVSCSQPLQRYICNVDQPEFIRRNGKTTTKKPTVTVKPTTKSPGTGTYCQQRYIYSKHFCYRQFVFPSKTFRDFSPICKAFGSEIIPVDQWKPANSPFAIYAQNQVPKDKQTVLCRKPAFVNTRFGTRLFPIPENHFDCFVRHWHGYLDKMACYRIFRDESMPITYAAARQRCIGFGGDLVFITDEKELKYVTVLGHWGSPAMLHEQVAIGGRDNGNFDGKTRCARLLADKLIYANNKVQPHKIGTLIGFDCKGTVTSYMCKVAYKTMKDKYSFEESDPVEVTCPSTSDKISSKECRCKPGYTDILDTTMADRHLYERGKRCIKDAPCDSVTQEIDLLFVVDDSGSITSSDWTYIVKFLKDAVNVVPRRGNVGFIKYSTYVNGFWLSSGFTDKEYLDKVPSIQDGYRTNTPGALDKATDMLREKNSKKKVVILITDGVPQISGYTDEQANEMTIAAANKLRNNGARLLVVGIGEYLVGLTGQMLQWVATPSDFFNYAQHISSLNQQHMRNILMTVCQD